MSKKKSILKPKGATHWIKFNKAMREYQIAKHVKDKEGMKLAKRRANYHLRKVF